MYISLLRAAAAAGGIIVMLFLLCGYCFKKRSRLRYPLTAVTVTLYLFSILPVAGMLMQGLEKQYVPPALEKIIGKTDVVVVLGGGAVRDVPISVVERPCRRSL